MQRLAGDFTVKRSVQVAVGEKGNMTVKELYELPNGQWQFGKGRDAVIISSIEQVAEFDAGTRDDVQKWLDRIKTLQIQPTPVVQGGAPALNDGQSSRDQLVSLISRIPDNIVDRMLLAMQQTLEPMADSINQAGPVNSHGDGYGQDQHNPVPGAVPFSLPEGAVWADPGRPESGYYTLDFKHTEKRKLPNGQIIDEPTRQWHPTPQFHSIVERAPEKSDIEIEMAEERRKFEAQNAERAEDEDDEDEKPGRQLVGAGSGRRTSRARR